MAILRVRGESRGEYFWVVCEDCGEHVSIAYVKPVAAGPQLEAECRKCGTKTVKKLMHHWRSAEIQ